MKFKTIVFALILAFISSTSPALAGGGLVSFDVPWNGNPLNPGEQYIVRPTVKQNDGNFCKNCPITIKLENPQADDLINGSSDKTDENGTMYAKVISRIPGNRVIFAEVTMPDGSLYTSSKYILNYKGENSGSSPSFSGNFVVTVTSQNTFNAPTYKGHPREVFLKWNELPGADFYEVYSRASGTEGWAIPEDGVTRENNLKIILSSDYDYYVKIQGCNNSGCSNSNELFVPKYDSKKVSSPTSITSTVDTQKVDELNQKVDQLEDKLNSTQKKQFILEEKLNQLINWLKSLFPNFK